MAYGRKGDLAQADLASAQAAFTRGDFKTARELAARAKTRFAVGSPGWVKADDIASLHGRPSAAQLTTRPKGLESHAHLLRSPVAAAPCCRSAAASTAHAQSVSDAQRGEIEKIIREYLIKQSGGAPGGDRRAGEAAGRRRGREAQGGGQGQRRGAVQFAAPGRGRQSAGRRHLRRVLRLQLRLLQARHDRHDRR